MASSSVGPTSTTTTTNATTGEVGRGAWLEAGPAGQRQVRQQWEQREAGIREAVSEVWSEHGSAFAAYWREELHEQPDVRAAMFLAALQDLLSLEDDKDDMDHHDDDGERPEGCQQQLQLGPLVGVACPELQDIPHLLASPDLLLALLTEPYLHHQRQHLGPPPQQQQHEEGEEAVGREALHAVRRCCLLQLGCNLLLLSLAAPEGEEESPCL